MAEKVRKAPDLGRREAAVQEQQWLAWARDQHHSLLEVVDPAHADIIAAKLCLSIEAWAQLDHSHRCAAFLIA